MIQQRKSQVSPHWQKNSSNILDWKRWQNMPLLLFDITRFLGLEFFPGPWWGCFSSLSLPTCNFLSCLRACSQWWRSCYRLIGARVFNSGRKKKSESTDKTDISGILGFFIFIFIFIIFYLFFNLLFSIKNIHKINFGR